MCAAHGLQRSTLPPARVPSVGKLLEGVQEAEAALAPWMPPARLAQLTERRSQLGALLAQLQAGLLRPSGGECAAWGLVGCLWIREQCRGACQPAGRRVLPDGCPAWPPQ